ncbi:MAG: hypothetical protein AB8F94_24670 [Saprospiraceae bacterium]
MSVKHSIVLNNFSFSNYTIKLCDGKEFRREDNEYVPYDFLISIVASIDNPGVGLELSPGSTSFFYPFDTLPFYINLFFSDSRKLPRKPNFDLDSMGGIYSSLIGNTYKSTKFFQNYVDILRNEAPLFLNFFGKINEKKSNYNSLLEGNRSTKNRRFHIKASGSIMISTSAEKVGEGEEK